MKFVLPKKTIQIQSDAYQRVGGNLFNFTVENDAHHNSATSAYRISSGMSPSWNQNFWRNFLIPFQPSVCISYKTSQLICTLNHDWFLYEMQHRAEIGLEKLKIPYLEYCNAQDYVYYLLYLSQEVKPSKNENQRPTSANASSPDKSNRFTFNIWLSTLTLVTPKSTPIVGKYLLTKRFSQYLLIKHVLPVCVSPRLITFTRVVFLSALMIWRERPLISWLLGSETHCARFLSSFYLRRKKG